MLELLLEESDSIEFQRVFPEVELKTYFSGKYDSSDAIVSIHAGQGGAERDVVGDL